MFNCLDVNQSDSCVSKRQRQQHSDETDEQEDAPMGVDQCQNYAWYKIVQFYTI